MCMCDNQSHPSIGLNRRQKKHQRRKKLQRQRNHFSSVMRSVPSLHPKQTKSLQPRNISTSAIFLSASIYYVSAIMSNFYEAFLVKLVARLADVCILGLDIIIKFLLSFINKFSLSKIEITFMINTKFGKKLDRRLQQYDINWTIIILSQESS